METALKIIGDRLRKVFGDPAKSAMGWNLIDAFTRLEEREEALKQDDEKSDGKEGPPLEPRVAGPVDNDN
jgi:hypothetical protein